MQQIIEQVRKSVDAIFHLSTEHQIEGTIVATRPLHLPLPKLISRSQACLRDIPTGGLYLGCSSLYRFSPPDTSSQATKPSEPTKENLIDDLGFGLRD